MVLLLPPVNKLCALFLPQDQPETPIILLRIIILTRYHIIYDGNCNLCVTFTQLLAKFDTQQQFDYVPMQDQLTLQRFNVTEQDCQMGMILIEAQNPQNRWQGSNAAEEIVHLLPMGKALIEAYRLLPGGKWIGDRTYEQIRDHRYALFGKRQETYFCPPKG